MKISDLGICGKLNSTFDMKSSWVGTTIYMSVNINFLIFHLINFNLLFIHNIIFLD